MSPTLYPCTSHKTKEEASRTVSGMDVTFWGPEGRPQSEEPPNSLKSEARTLSFGQRTPDFYGGSLSKERLPVACHGLSLPVLSSPKSESITTSSLKSYPTPSSSNVPNLLIWNGCRCVLACNPCWGEFPPVCETVKLQNNAHALKKKKKSNRTGRGQQSWIPLYKGEK